MSENVTTSPTPELTKEESAFFAKTFWTAIQVPKWPRQKLIEFGHLVHAKTPLAKFSDAQVTTFLPYLKEIATSFGDAISKVTKRAAPLQKDEIAHIIRLLWDSLITPNWTSDDLIEFGKAVFTKTPLPRLSQHQFEILFPHLTAIANKVGIAMLSQATTPTNTAAPPSPTSPDIQPPPPTQDEPHGQ